MKKNRWFAGVTTGVIVISLLAGCANANSAPAPAATQAAKTEAAASDKEVSAATSAENVSWPSSAVQLLVPSKAGGITDIYTRYVQESLQKSTGGNFATVNYDTEAVGYENLRSANPDGTTLLFQHSTLICKYLTGAVEYNPSTEFRVVGEVANMGSQAIICGPDAPYNTWDEFVSYAKEHPGEVTTAIATNGTTHFIFGQVQKNCGVELNMVECSAEADKLTNVAGGIIDVANCSLGSAKEYENAGKLKVLGVLGSGEPEENYPEWEPIKDVIWVSHLYCFAPADTDDATAEAINAALKTLVQDSNYEEQTKKIGGAPEYYDLKACEEDFAKTLNELSEVATSLGINVR